MSAESIGVDVDRISKRYAHRVKGEVYAARDVVLNVRPGEFLTLLGPSGCGKTTTLRMIAGYEMPDAGRIRFGGQDVTAEPANRRNIGFVFQNYALFPHLSIFDNVAYGLNVRKVPAAEVRQRVGEVLSLVGLAGYEGQFSGQLSGGEQQRVALARAIVIRPRVLLFDEPLSNLDAKLRVQMRHEIRDLQRRLAITTVYVTHDQEEAMAVSDRIAVMNEGSVVQEGSAEDLYHRPASQFVAQFVGRVNLVAGRVAAVAGDAVTVAALGTTIGARAARAGLAPGDPVRLVVRPESIAIAAAWRRGRIVAGHGDRADVPRREDRIPVALRRRDAAGRAVRRRTRRGHARRLDRRGALRGRCRDRAAGGRGQGHVPCVIACVAALLWLACCGAMEVMAADGSREVHGSADVFAAPGVALAWGVLRGATEADTRIVIRIATDRNAFAAVSVIGSDPFTKGERSILPVTPTATNVDVRVPRAHFADFPRTELRLFGSANPAPDEAPKLVVFYLGVPDTAPEFPSAAALETYLAARIARARDGTGSKTP